MNFVKPSLNAQPHDAFHTWPRALAIPGWRHQIDLLIRFGVGTLRWFPLWLVRIKALTAFLRNDTHKQAITQRFAVVGLLGLVGVRQRLSIPSFADWRWGTLLGVMHGLMPILDSLIAHLVLADFRNARDTVGLQHIARAFASTDWRKQCDFIHWMAQWLGAMQTWVGGCPCHVAAFEVGE